MDQPSRDAAVAALTAGDLDAIVDLVAYPEHGPGSTSGPIMVVNSGGAVRLTPDGAHRVLRGRDPVGDTDPLAFLPYEREQADPAPPNRRNAYPEPYRRLASAFADPTRSPDLAIVHTGRHYFPDEGGHLGDHGSLSVIQSRAPLLTSGAGVPRHGVRQDWARMVDVAPTLLRAAGVDPAQHATAAGAPLDGAARPDLISEPGGGRWVIGLLWDGAHCSDLLHLAGTGELPGVARLLESGTALAGGAVAEFPSVTLCNHTSALTGVGPGRHGVLNNVFFDRQTGQQVVSNDATMWHRSAEWLHPQVSTVYEMLAAARPGARSASINEAIDRGADVSTMQLIRASGGDGAGDLDHHLPPAEGSPFLSNADHLADDYFRWASRVDDAGLGQVLQVWAAPDTAPTLTWWSHVVTDAGHHAGGPRSTIARDSLRDADRRLQALLDHLDRLGVSDEVTFLLTADHGFEGADPAVTGSWQPALHAALDPLGIRWRDEGPGFVYLLG